MKRIGVQDKNGVKLIKTLKNSLPGDFTIEKADCKNRYDVIVLKDKDLENLRGIRAKYAVLFPEARISSPLNIEYALSCGSRETDTLTLSSFFSHGGVASLRREIKSINGKKKEPCEIELDLGGEMDEKLAVAAIKLIFDLI